MAIAKPPEATFDLTADNASLERPAQKDASIVVGLFKAHAKRVQKFLAFRLRDAADAQDATQDVFLKLWRQESQGTLRDEATNYMYSATHSAAIDTERHRAYVSRDRISDVDVDDVAQPKPAAEEVLHWRKAMARLVDSVKALPETSKKVFVLFHFKGMSYDEIAAELGCSRRTVERHVAAGLAFCKERMKDYL
jgi:RNA polymerase sigma factor (sigma-70 family)